jgi:hypothetical protein
MTKPSKESGLFNWRLRLQTSGIYRFAAIPARDCSATGRSDLRPSGLAPGVSAQVASLQSLTLCPGQHHCRKNLALEKLVVVADREK